MNNFENMRQKETKSHTNDLPFHPRNSLALQKDMFGSQEGHSSPHPENHLPSSSQETTTPFPNMPFSVDHLSSRHRVRIGDLTDNPIQQGSGEENGETRTGQIETSGNIEVVQQDPGLHLVEARQQPPDNEGLHFVEARQQPLDNEGLQVVTPEREYWSSQLSRKPVPQSPNDIRRHILELPGALGRLAPQSHRTMELSGGDSEIPGDAQYTHYERNKRQKFVNELKKAVGDGDRIHRKKTQISQFNSILGDIRKLLNSDSMEPIRSHIRRELINPVRGLIQQAQKHDATITSSWGKDSTSVKIQRGISSMLSTKAGRDSKTNQDARQRASTGLDRCSKALGEIRGHLTAMQQLCEFRAQQSTAGKWDPGYEQQFEDASNGLYDILNPDTTPVNKTIAQEQFENACYQILKQSLNEPRFSSTSWTIPRAERMLDARRSDAQKLAKQPDMFNTLVDEIRPMIDSDDNGFTRLLRQTNNSEEQCNITKWRSNMVKRLTTLIYDFRDNAEQFQQCQDKGYKNTLYETNEELRQVSSLLKMLDIATDDYQCNRVWLRVRQQRPYRPPGKDTNIRQLRAEQAKYDQDFGENETRFQQILHEHVHHGLEAYALLYDGSFLQEPTRQTIERKLREALVFAAKLSTGESRRAQVGVLSHPSRSVQNKPHSAKLNKRRHKVPGQHRFLRPPY